jgi:transcriptional regulator of acetoin/glycerol metabolism
MGIYRQSSKRVLPERTVAPGLVGAGEPQLCRNALRRKVVIRYCGADGGLKSLARSGKDEAEAIARALEETNWNRKQAAALLKISYKALPYKIRQYGIAQSRSTHRLSAGA